MSRAKAIPLCRAPGWDAERSQSAGCPFPSAVLKPGAGAGSQQVPRARVGWRGSIYLRWCVPPGEPPASATRSRGTAGIALCIADCKQGEGWGLSIGFSVPEAIGGPSQSLRSLCSHSKGDVTCACQIYIGTSESAGPKGDTSCPLLFMCGVNRTRAMTRRSAPLLEQGILSYPSLLMAGRVCVF